MTQSSEPPSMADVGQADIFEIRIPPLGLAGTLQVPRQPKALVVFAHGSGSSRFSPRNMAVATALNRHGMATLLFDLLTEDEEADRANVFDIPLLSQRLVDAVRSLKSERAVRGLPVGLFGASTGAGAALVAAAEMGTAIGAVVSRGGRPDLAADALDRVRTPTLLIVGGADDVVIELNQAALARLKGPKELRIVPGATHLFSEPRALEQVIEDAADWFERYLVQKPSGRRSRGAPNEEPPAT
jgi:putative phosphoribosyl transferase